MTRELRANWKFYSVYFLLVVFLTAVFTWPLLLNLQTSIYGYSGDSFGFIYYLWLWKEHFLKGLPLTFNPRVMAPFGTVFAPETGTVVFYWPTKLLALIFNPVVSYNLNLLLSFILSALAAYLFIYEVSQSRWTAAVFSLVFSFSPYHFWKAYNHLDLAMIQYIPLYLWALVKLGKEPRMRTALLTGLTLTLLVLLNFYYAYFALLALGLFWVFALVEGLWKKRSLAPLKYYLLPPFLAALLSLPFLYPILPGSSPRGLPRARQEAYHRPLDNLLLLSARPWNYLLPSIDNPFLGSLSKRAYQYLETLSQDFKTRTPFPNETTVYLGFFSVLFFLLSLYLFRKNLVDRRLVALLGFSAGGLFLISLPPFVIIKAKTLYLPGFFLYQFLPMFRSYGRLGIFVLPLVTGAASLAFAYVTSKRGLARRFFLVSLSFVFIFLEFLNFPPGHVTRFLPLPAAYAWLKEQSGDFIIMEYPKDFGLADGEFYQMFHQKRLANWYSTYPYYDLWRWVEDIYQPQTYEILAGLGVKYVVFHKRLLFPEPNPVDELWPRQAYAEPLVYESLPVILRPVEKFTDEDIFEITVDNPPRVAVFTKEGRGSVKTDFPPAPRGGPQSKELYLFNLTGQELTAELRDGSRPRSLIVGLGLSLLERAVSSDSLQIKVL